MKPKILSILIAVLGLLAYFPAAASACAVCWAGDGGPADNAFNWSVLFLMAAPYTVVGSIAAGLFLAYRRSAANPAKTKSVEPLVHLTLNPEDGGR